MKIIYETYDNETYETIVTIATEFGQFTGTARAAEEDQPTASVYAGWHVAYAKAMQKYYKEKIKRLKIAKKELQKICNMATYLTQDNNAIYMGATVWVISKREKAIDSQISDLNIRCEYIKQDVAKYLEERDNLLKKVSNKRKSKKDNKK